MVLSERAHKLGMLRDEGGGVTLYLYQISHLEYSVWLESYTFNNEYNVETS